MTYVIDIDETITLEEVHYKHYDLARPNLEMIKKVNDLYDKGNIIIFYTSRYMEDKDVTQTWLIANNVKHHEIQFEKPKGDFYIDKKNMSMEEFLCQSNETGGIIKERTLGKL